jgi:hypothetical protein
MIAPTTTITSNRKRSRPLQKQGPVVAVASSPKTSLRLLALAIFLVLSSQAACAFADSASVVSSQTTFEIANNDSLEQYENIQRFELDEIDEEEKDEIDEEDQHENDCIEEYEEEWNEDEWDDEEDDQYYEDEEGNDNEEGYDFDEEEDYEDDWTPEEYKQIELLYDRYIVQIARIYGHNWQEEYELVAGKEEIYGKYLEFEERKQREAQERRQLSMASHKALLHHEGDQESSSSHRDIERGQNNNDNEYSQNCTEDDEEESAAATAPLGDKNKNAMAFDIPPQRDMVVLKTDDSYGVQSNGNDCPAATPTTIIAIRNGNSERVIGSI